ncbi:Aldo keto reductase [Athelia psychrophila]|uniref:Aldo keto reductase n=1 Tax=Athelia psychrophila TaxID=1759441 RepID=A0A165Z6B6_9AGAM|nr:Aldo keto reductase [Fibularhizoctonia sp. CBS 109695]
MSAIKSMPYVRLGKSGLKVSKIILGCMSYGSPGWQPWILEEAESITHIKAAYDLGINTFDTANAYSNGASEVILGKAIKQHNINRDEIVVMTKVWATVGRGDTYLSLMKPAMLDSMGYANQRGLSRKHIFESVKHSLARLQLDYVDVLQCHRFDSETPIAETMHALHDVVQAGYARYIGMSSCWAWQFQLMQNYALTHNLTPFISMQNHLNLLYREEEREMLPMLEHFGVGSIPWSPLARGMLARPLAPSNAASNTGEVKTKTTREEVDTMLGGYLRYPSDSQLVDRWVGYCDRLEEIAAKKGASMAQVALAWLMQKDGVTAPVVGSTSLDNLRDLVGAIHVALTAEEARYLEENYQSRNVFGHS